MTNSRRYHFQSQLRRKGSCKTFLETTRGLDPRCRCTTNQSHQADDGFEILLQISSKNGFMMRHPVAKLASVIKLLKDVRPPDLFSEKRLVQTTYPEIGHVSFGAKGCPKPKREFGDNPPGSFCLTRSFQTVFHHLNFVERLKVQKILLLQFIKPLLTELFRELNVEGIAPHDFQSLKRTVESFG